MKLDTVEIYMELADGSLRTIFAPGRNPLPPLVIKDLFKHILQALDYLDSRSMMHGDVKPDNILVSILPQNSYCFKLGDFGLCKLAISECTQAGSMVYMAPELTQRQTRTSKADMWSLFLTMVWAYNINNFHQRERDLENPIDILEVAFGTGDKRVEAIREMAATIPDERASAAQMLMKHFQGEGSSTPRENILPLPALERPSALSMPGGIVKPPTTTTKRRPRPNNRNKRRRANQWPRPSPIPAIHSLPMARGGTPDRWDRALGKHTT
jgi:serine/threonine protein kinase